MESFIAWGLTTLIGAFVGSYLAGYLKKKGDNLATKEDFDDLKKQTRELTQTTKEIEAKINDQVWNRQRQWEMQRDVLIEYARTISDFEQAIMLISIRVVHRNKAQFQVEQFRDALTGLNKSSDKFVRESFIVELVVSTKTQAGLRELSQVLRNACDDILQSERTDTYSSHHKEIVWKLENVKELIREELGIMTTTKFRLNETSALTVPTAQVFAPSVPDQ